VTFGGMETAGRHFALTRSNLYFHLKPSTTPATIPYNYHIMTTTNSCIWSFERVFAILMGMERLNGVEFVYHAVLPFLPMAVFVVDA